MLPTPDSRFGMNAAAVALAPRLSALGVGWVRFENMKWPFFSPDPHVYTFTGEVAPWHVNADQIFGAYRDAGLNVLSYMFLVPEWASQPPDDGAQNMRLAHPPRDPSLYGEFCFQVVARYGSKEHPPEALKTEDKVSGLDLVNCYEMYNEPNLNPSPDATWGGWAAPMDQYYEMMRFGAEAVKKADPDAVVTSAGYAGMTVDVVDPLRTYTYADGKHPLDFIDVLNVHYYSGLVPPETARTDGNIQATGAFTFPENLQELAQWRDRYAPGMPIWMTETGYDSAGPFGTNEEIQAARLPRVIMLCLAHGVDKVFVYRESGSTASMHAASGVLRNDHSKKPSWHTFATLIRQFRDVAGGAVRLPHPDSNVWLMEWDSGGKPLLTAWTVSGSAPLGVDLGPCTIVDAFGGESRPESTADVAVTPYPLYIRDFADMAALDDLRREFRALEVARAARRAHILGLRKYLFDFGTAEHVAAFALEGTKTPFVPMSHTAVWDEATGYGFVAPAMSDDDRRWLGRDKLNRDSSRVRDHTFRFGVEPGRYALEAKVEPFGEPVEVTVAATGAEPVTRTATKEEPVVKASLVVAGEGGTIDVHVHGGYAHIYWITCVEDAG